jgi:hypothetical protein
MEREGLFDGEGEGSGLSVGTSVSDGLWDTEGLFDGDREGSRDTDGSGEADGAAVASKITSPTISTLSPNAAFRMPSNAPDNASICAALEPAPVTLLPILYSAVPLKCRSEMPGGLVPGPVSVWLRNVDSNPSSILALNTILRCSSMMSMIESRSAALMLLLARIVKGARSTKNEKNVGDSVRVGTSVLGDSLGPGVVEGALDGVGVGAGLSDGTPEGMSEADGLFVVVGNTDGEGVGAGESLGAFDGFGLAVGTIPVGLMLGEGDGRGLSVGTSVGETVFVGADVVDGAWDGLGDGPAVSVGALDGTGEADGAVGTPDGVVLGLLLGAPELLGLLLESEGTGEAVGKPIMNGGEPSIGAEVGPGAGPGGNVGGIRLMKGAPLVGWGLGAAVAVGGGTGGVGARVGLPGLGAIV